MSEHRDTLEAVVERIAQEPQSAASLTLYALVNTMEYEQAGCLFKLNKLRDLPDDDRRLAYQLMEAMVDGVNQTDAWISARHQMDKIIREG